MLSNNKVLAVGLLFSPLFADYVHVQKGCVNGHNIGLFKFKSIYECKQLCDANEDCLAFEYGVAYGGGGAYVSDDCQLQSSVDARDCDGGYWNLDLYVKSTYAHFAKACVHGQNIELYKSKSILECQQLCDARCDCEAIEYGAAYGGSGRYEPQDCQLQSSALRTDCDGAHFNLDLWVKRDRATCAPTSAPTPQPTLEPTATGYEHVPRGCVNGANIVLYHEKTVSQCEELCDADARCKAFEFGVMHGGNGKYRPGDCQLQSSSVWHNCNGGHHNLELYIKGTYERFMKSCVNGRNIKLYPNKSIQQCRELCDAQEACKAFEYGVAYGGFGGYNPKDCQLQSSADRGDCDGAYHNLDLYVKGYGVVAESHSRLL